MIHIPAYCTLNFLEEITRRNPVDFITPENSLAGKTHYELLDLIAEGLTIKTDCDAEKLKEKSTTNAYIKYLIKGNRISCKETDFQELRTNCNTFFSKVKDPICLYLLTNCDGMLKEYSQKTGNYVLSLESTFTSIFEERLQTFKPNEAIGWDFTKGFFEPHHSVVIADPYLFSSRDVLAKLIENMLPQKMIAKYHITLIGADENKAKGLAQKKLIETWVKDFCAKVNRNIAATIEYHIYNKEDFHDRIIITNNACIFSGIGLGMIKNEKSQKDTTWIGFKPFKRLSTNNNNSVLVYELMRRKLAVMKTWISKSEQKSTQNPLFTQFP